MHEPISLVGRTRMNPHLGFVVFVAAMFVLGCGSNPHRTEQSDILTTPQAESPAKKSDIEASHVRGNPNASVTIEEFGDFECSGCAKISVMLEQLLKDYDPRIRLIFRNFPHDEHKHARAAALAAEAAGLQGRFWDMHDLLFGDQSVWSKSDNASELFEGYAEKLGFNVDQFRKDMEGEAAKLRVDSDLMRATSLGVESTPTLFINKKRVAFKDLTMHGLRAAIDAELQVSAVDSGTP